MRAAGLEVMSEMFFLSTLIYMMKEQERRSIRPPVPF